MRRQGAGLRPGKILWEVQEAYQPGIVTEKLTRGPLEYTAIWQVAQRLTDKPVSFGAICAPGLASMLWDEHYHDDRALILDLCDIMNAEFKELAAAGCPGDPGRGAAPSRHDDLARLQGQRSRFSDRGVYDKRITLAESCWRQLIALAALSVFSTLPAFADSSFQAGQTVVVVGTDGRGLRLRVGPGMAHRILTTVAEGASVQVVSGPVSDGDDDWYQVSASTASGAATTGWAVSTYLFASTALQSMSANDGSRVFLGKVTAYAADGLGGVRSGRGPTSAQRRAGASWPSIRRSSRLAQRCASKATTTSSSLPKTLAAPSRVSRSISGCQTRRRRRRTAPNTARSPFCVKAQIAAPVPAGQQSRHQGRRRTH